ncbi:MAG TPA: DUF5938 domain-containing protein [Polyangiales bacterium]
MHGSSEASRRLRRQGYTGRLTCESLTALKVPFIAAGRNQGRLDAVVSEIRARGADCEARVTEHTPWGLRELLHGMKVVINTSGPFSLLGHAVVDAALAEGCHYVDSTGEQDFMLDVRRDFSSRYAREKLVLAPSTAFLWGPGSAAAELVLETPGIDTLEVTYAPPSLQTVASLQSMARSLRRPGFSIVDGMLRPVPIPDVRRVTLPNGETRGALRIAAGEATFFLDDPRVRRCDTLFANDLLARAGTAAGLWNKLGRVLPGETLDKWSDAVIVRVKKDPPAEQPESGRFVITVVGQGGGKTVRAVLNGTSPYVFTGFMGAMAAQALLEGKAQRFGYGSIAQALGARYVLGRMEEIGTKATFEPPVAARSATGADSVARASSRETRHVGE